MTGYHRIRPYRLGLDSQEIWQPTFTNHGHYGITRIWVSPRSWLIFSSASSKSFSFAYQGTKTSHIPPNGKFGNSSTQQCRRSGGDMFLVPRMVLRETVHTSGDLRIRQHFIACFLVGKTAYRRANGGSTAPTLHVSWWNWWERGWVSNLSGYSSSLLIPWFLEVQWNLIIHLWSKYIYNINHIYIYIYL